MGIIKTTSGNFLLTSSSVFHFLSWQLFIATSQNNVSQLWLVDLYWSVGPRCAVVAQIAQVPKYNVISLSESTRAPLPVEDPEHQRHPVEWEKFFFCQNLHKMLQEMFRTGSYQLGKTIETW